MLKLIKFRVRFIGRIKYRISANKHFGLILARLFTDILSVILDGTELKFGLILIFTVTIALFGIFNKSFEFRMLLLSYTLK